MRVVLTAQFTRTYEKAPQRVQKDFGKQLGFLLANPKHPSLRIKKHDESHGVFQARVNDDWRFYFEVKDDAYVLSSITPHPK